MWADSHAAPGLSRLISELQLTPMEAYERLKRLISEARATVWSCS